MTRVIKLKPLDEAIAELKALYKSIEEGGDCCPIDIDEHGHCCNICGMRLLSQTSEKEQKSGNATGYTNI